MFYEYLEVCQGDFENFDFSRNGNQFSADFGLAQNFIFSFALAKLNKQVCVCVCVCVRPCVWSQKLQNER